MKKLIPFLFVIFISCNESKTPPKTTDSFHSLKNKEKVREILGMTMVGKLGRLKALKNRGVNFSEIQKIENESMGMELNSFVTAAIGSGEVEVAKFMLSELNVDIKTLHQCPIEFAFSALEISEGKQMIDYLLELGADINCNKDISGLGGALASAIDTGELEYVEYLVLKGAKVDQDYSAYGSPLIYAMKEEKPEVAMFLAKKSQDFSFRDDDGKNALDIARALKYDDIVKILESRITLNK